MFNDIIIYNNCTVRLPSWPPLTRQDAQSHLTSSQHTLLPFSTAWSPLHAPSQWKFCRLQPCVKKTYPPGLKTTNLTSCSSLLPLPTVLACSQSHPAMLHPGCRSFQLGASTCTWTQPSSRWPSNGGWASTRHLTFGALIALTTS